jgi:hypothetical protein
MKPALACLILSCLLSDACYLRPFRTNSPRRSTPDGVTLSLVGQDCADYTGTEGVPVHRDLLLKVRLKNASPQPLTFTPSAMQLTMGAHTTPPSFPSDPISVPPGAASTVVLKFTLRGRCNQEFSAAFPGAFKLGSEPVAMDALTFRPY